MTTLNPEERIEAAIKATLHQGRGPNIPVTRDDLRSVLATLSTERQAREAAEKEVERLSAECALGDMRASYDDLMEQHRATLSKLRAAEAALSALPHPVPAEEVETALREDESGNLREVLPTQAPQDVAGLVEEIAREIDRGAFRSVDEHLEIANGQSRRLTLSGAGNGEIALANMKALEPRRISALDAASRILALLRASPISHETETANDDLGPSAPWCAFINPDGYKPDHLELAAADNNHKALVEALERITRLKNGVGLGPARAIAETTLAAFQSRQEGK